MLAGMILSLRLITKRERVGLVGKSLAYVIRSVATKIPIME